jgi:SAM-dependent methyltransferase
MNARDAATLDFYDVEAVSYASRGQAHREDRLADFAKRLPAGGRILELGCGAGQDSQALLEKGFDVTPTDGSPKLAELAAKRLGRAVEVLLFEDIAHREAFDGIWAHACLLHVPRDALAPIIERIHAALRPNGVFYASFKAGNAEGRDRFGRYFNYPSPQWLRSAYAIADWRALDITEAMGGGYDREPTAWLHALATKAA